MTALLFSAFIYAVALWLSIQINSVKGSVGGILLIVLLASLLSALPGSLGIFRFLIIGGLLSRLFDVKFIPDALIVVVIAEVITFGAVMALLPLIL